MNAGKDAYQLEPFTYRRARFSVVSFVRGAEIRGSERLALTNGEIYRLIGGAYVLASREAFMNYRGFEIETFKIGKGLWHARFRREDHRPILIDGVDFRYWMSVLRGRPQKQPLRMRRPA